MQVCSVNNVKYAVVSCQVFGNMQVCNVNDGKYAGV